MATTTVQEVSTEDIKEAIIALIKENNAEFQQLIDGLVSKKKKKQKQNTPITVVKKERVPYHEMPFWKANPDLKPLDASPYAIKKEDFYAALKEAQEAFKDLDISDEEWLEQIKD